MMSRHRVARAEPEGSEGYSERTIIAELRAILASRDKTIGELREKGKRVVADRDRWEALSKRYEEKIAEITEDSMSVPPTKVNGSQFQELKMRLPECFTRMPSGPPATPNG